MKKRLLFICTVLLGMSIALQQAQAIVPRDTLCTPNPSKEAVALYRYLLDMKGKKILSGQMLVPWGLDALSYINTNTGKQPAIRGIDFMTQSENAKEVQNAINCWNAGGIPTIMWHWGAPSKGEGYPASKLAIEIDSCFKVGTTQYTAFWSELKIKADLLVQLRDAHIPILWRPFHELNGNWFWWGKQGPDKFKKLWTTMFNYFVKDRGLNNLIWVLCYTGSPEASWYPGDEYVDIAGADTYGSGNGPQLTMYNSVKNITNNRFPLAYHECGIPPVPDQCLTQGAMWSWWMEWHTDYLTSVNTSYLSTAYNHDLVITLDEVPNIMTVYGWDSKLCQASVITPKVKVDNGEWQQTNNILLNSTSSAILSPQVTDNGTWSWNGYGTSGSSAEQTVSIQNGGTATAVFTNTCGATSTATFNVTATPVTAINKTQENATISLSPNPCTDILTVEIPQFSSDKHSEISIFTMQGTLVLKETTDAKTLNLNVSRLLPGMYHVTIVKNGINTTKSFIKVN